MMFLKWQLNMSLYMMRWSILYLGCNIYFLYKDNHEQYDTQSLRKKKYLRDRSIDWQILYINRGKTKKWKKFQKSS